MTADQAVVAILDALETASVPYMIVGSLASNFHGIPRSTRDADFVVELPPGVLQRLADALPPGLTLHSQAAFEAVTGTTRYLVELAGRRSSQVHGTAGMLEEIRASLPPP